MTEMKAFAVSPDGDPAPCGLMARTDRCNDVIRDALTEGYGAPPQSVTSAYRCDGARLHAGRRRQDADMAFACGYCRSWPLQPPALDGYHFGQSPRGVPGAG